MVELRGAHPIRKRVIGVQVLYRQQTMLERGHESTQLQMNISVVYIQIVPPMKYSEQHCSTARKMHEVVCNPNCMTKKYDYLIVGSGLYGCTFAYCASQAGKSVLVIDKRNHFGGNVYCESINEINVHKYGAHIFHTSNEEVYKFVTSKVSVRSFINSPLANYNGEVYNLPFNMNTFYRMWNVSTPEAVNHIISTQRQGINKIQSLEDKAISLVGKDVYEKLIKGYTEKQWGMKCSELPAFLINRIPVRLTYDNNYFDDKYQFIPVGGYNGLIDILLEGCSTELNADFFEHREGYSRMADKIVFTGKIDQYYDYCFGRLDYRSLRFETEVLFAPNFQGNAVVNYTSAEVPYTRIIEHKHFEMSHSDIYNNDTTVVTKEYPQPYSGTNEAYYPINNERNNGLYNTYKLLADKEERVIFGGRLAEYKYYDMDDIIYNVLKLWKYV